MMPKSRSAIGCVALVLLAACASSTDEGGAALELRGTWNYMATQAGSAAVLDGTVVIDRQDGVTFSGQFNGHVHDPDGIITDVDGVVSGRAFGKDAVDFDLFISGAERRHVGRIARADSIGGTWAQQSAAASISGAFSLTSSPGRP